MSSFLFATWDGGGNLPPTLGIATELSARGHEVRFVGHASQAARLAGFDLTTYETDLLASAGPGLGRLLATFADRAQGRRVVEAARARPADVVVVDCYLFGVMTELQRAAIPYVVLEHSLDGNFRAELRGPLALLLRLRGVRPAAAVASARSVIVPTLADLDTGADPSVLHTGPVVDAVAAAPAEPTVLVSLSTVRFKGLIGAWQRALDALAGLPARVVATTGPAVDPAELRIPRQVEVHRWLEHAEVMPSASLVIGHGGHATTIAALAHGLPLVVVPVEAKSDQRSVGRAVERAGAGRCLPRTASPTVIRAAVEELLTDGPHRAAARALGERIRAVDGAARAADALESLVPTSAR